MSEGSNRQLFKRGIGSTGKKANIHQRAANELGDIYTQYFNQFTDKPMEEYKVDYKQYTLSTLKLIDKCQNSRLAKSYIESLKPVKQISLF